jgi:hypothetical protein
VLQKYRPKKCCVTYSYVVKYKDAMPSMMKKDNFKLDADQRNIVINAVAHCDMNQWATVLKIILLLNVMWMNWFD